MAPPSVLMEWREQIDKHTNHDLFSKWYRLREFGYNENSNLITLYERQEQLDSIFNDDHEDYNDTISTILLVSYNSVRNNAVQILEQPWNHVIFDECHIFKNMDTYLHKKLVEHLPPHIKRIGLSGTPNANQPEQDLCGIMQIVCPKIYNLHKNETHKFCEE